MTSPSKTDRLAHANALIKVISDHGRRFFWDKDSQRIARLEVDARGRVWWIDDYREARVYTHRATFGNDWRGFSHGGTLRALVEDMRDYISKGQCIARWKIAPERLCSDGDIWGYGPHAAGAVRVAAFALPIMEGHTQ